MKSITAVVVQRDCKAETDKLETRTKMVCMPFMFDTWIDLAPVISNRCHTPTPNRSMFTNKCTGPLVLCHILCRAVLT